LLVWLLLSLATMGMEVLLTIPMVDTATPTEAHRVCTDTTARGRLNLGMDMVTDMELPQSMFPSMIMATDTTHNHIPTDTILDMGMERGQLMLNQDMEVLPTTHTEVTALSTEAPRVLLDTMDMADMDTMERDPPMLNLVTMAMLSATLTEAHRVFMAIMAMDTMAMVDTDIMERDPLMLSQVTMAMLSATLTEAHRVSMATTVMAITVMADMVTMERDLLMLDTTMVPAHMSTRAAHTTMDPMDMVSTTMVRGLLKLVILDMDIIMDMVEAATSMLTDHTLLMVSVLPTPTKCDRDCT